MPCSVLPRLPLPAEFSGLHARAMRGESAAMDMHNDIGLCRVHAHQRGKPGYVLTDRNTGAYMRLTRAQAESEETCYLHVVAFVCALRNGHARGEYVWK